MAGHTSLEEAQEAAQDLSARNPEMAVAVLEWATDDSRSGDQANEYEVRSYANRADAEAQANLVALYLAGALQD